MKIVVDPRALSAAAAAGLMLAACESKKGEAPEAASSAQAVTAASAEAKACCMGLNECKGKGGCAVPESHACAGKNDCKGKGGCNHHCPK